MKSNLDNQNASTLRTIPQAAAALGVGRSTIYELIRQKRLEAVKIGRCTRVPADAIMQFISQLRTQG